MVKKVLRRCCTKEKVPAGRGEVSEGLGKVYECPDEVSSNQRKFRGLVEKSEGLWENA
jgi:hypothetical protein